MVIQKKIKLSAVLVLIFLLGVVIGLLIQAPQIEGNLKPDIKPIIDRDYFPTVHAELQKATKSIHIAMFSLTYYLEYPNSHVNDLLNDLIHAHKRGLDVKVVVDEFPEDIDRGVIYLKEKGIPVRYDKKGQSTHAKLIIIDSDTIIVGSTNWRYYSVDKNHEANVIIYSRETAKKFEQYFNSIWNESRQSL